MSDVVERAKSALEGVTEGPWEAQDWTSHANGERGCGILAGIGMKQRGIAWTGQHHWNPEAEAQADAEFIAAARTLVPELVAEVERLRAAEWSARGERDSMKRRLELLTADESWWIGGAWGDYGEVVLPVRALHMVLGQKMVGQSAVGEPELDPGLASTYRDLRATVEDLSDENARLRQELEAR